MMKDENKLTIIENYIFALYQYVPIYSATHSNPRKQSPCRSDCLLKMCEQTEVRETVL